MLVMNLYAGIMPVKEPEKNRSPSMTEQAGYVPTDLKIKEFFERGLALKEARAAQYDFPPGTKPNEEFFDPTRSPGFDLADATQLERAARDSVVEQARESNATNSVEKSLQAAETTPPVAEVEKQKGSD